MKGGDVVCLAGVYGLYEIIWEVSKVDPHWTRRKFIVIRFLIKKFYNNSETS